MKEEVYNATLLKGKTELPGQVVVCNYALRFFGQVRFGLSSRDILSCRRRRDILSIKVREGFLNFKFKNNKDCARVYDHTYNMSRGKTKKRHLKMATHDQDLNDLALAMSLQRR